MCGIAGELKCRDVPGIEDLEAWRDLMRRRGPDDEGCWRENDQRLTLVFRRLSILDLSPSGSQPMLDPTGRFVLVWNGELYNFRELRAELEAEGVRFRSSGDAEVALRALAHWGPEALPRFDAIFAFALWDRRRRELLLGRDPFGVKPLYLGHAAEGFVFSSQYEPLLVHPWLRHRSLSLRALGCYLRLGFIPAPSAILEGTEMVEAGAWIRVSEDGEIERGRHFSFDDSDPDLRGEEADRAVRRAVATSVRRQLVSDVPLGTFLSGGVDSSLVTAEAAVAGANPPTFTIGMGAGPIPDESAEAGRIARELGLASEVRQADGDSALALVEDAVECLGEPFADPSIFPTLQVSALAADRVKVSLSGDGGDELFWGYDWRQPALIRAAPDFRRPLAWRTLRWWARRFLGLGSGYPHLRFPSLGRWYRERHAKLSEPTLQRIFEDPPPWPEDLGLFRFDGSDRDETARWLRRNELGWHLQMVLLKVDRASMFHSLEVRVPLLGRPVAEVASRLPWRECLDLKKGEGKQPLRRALSEHLNLSSETKRGFAPPIGPWLAGPLRSLVEDELLAARNLIGLQIRAKALERFADDVGRNPSSGPGLWTLVALALWERRRRSLVARFAG